MRRSWQFSRTDARGRCGLAALVAVTFATTVGAELTAQPSMEPTAEEDFALLPDVSTEEILSAPGLATELRADPYSYFRFVNVPFATAVCAGLGDEVSDWPTVNLHGDVHLEQYAVTTHGRGLSDFDSASTGPALLDLVRFGTSIVLACRARGWTEHQGELLGRFLDGYLAALADPNVEIPEPAWSARALAAFDDDRLAFLNWADSIVEPLEPDVADRLMDGGFRQYQELMRAENPDLGAGFFEPVTVGRLRTGLGSRLDTKYLVRIEGPTDEPADDIILEVKEVRDLHEITCIDDPGGGGALRILLGQARISTLPSDFLGQLPTAPTDEGDSRPFWVQRWFARYLELDTTLDPSTPAELGEIVFDVGAQLGRGHTNQIAEPMGSELRQSEYAVVESHREAIIEWSGQMAVRVLAGWERFRAMTAE